MFNKEFFPITDEIAEKMTAPYKISRVSNDRKVCILDPSAGKGNILDYLRDKKGYSNFNYFSYYAIEKNIELQMILKEKRYNVISDDFLNYSGEYYFDFIFMNPPFSVGDSHLLHAWNILKSGHIACLLNKETYYNTCTKKRKLLKEIIDKHGSVEDLGKCFKNAERKTDVEVILVRLNKEETDSTFEFWQNKTEEDDISFENILENPVAKRNVIENTVRRYEKVKSLYVEYRKILNQIKFYGQGIVNNSLYEMIKKADSKTDRESCNNFIDLLKSSCWGNIFRTTKFSEVMTEKVLRDFDTFRREQGGLDFTVENIESLLLNLQLSKKKILEGCLVDVFDRLTKYDKQNRSHWEGWKTNDAWRVNKKVIIPYCIKYMEYGRFEKDKFNLSYYERDFLNDIDRVMCSMAGKKIGNVRTIADALENKFKILGYVGKESFDNTCESHFFDMRFYKKGTLHLIFKDEKIWQEFNIRAAKGKGWRLPDDYNDRERREKKKEYAEAR